MSVWIILRAAGFIWSLTLPPVHPGVQQNKLDARKQISNMPQVQYMEKTSNVTQIVNWQHARGIPWSQTSKGFVNSEEDFKVYSEDHR